MNAAKILKKAYGSKPTYRARFTERGLQLVNVHRKGGTERLEAAKLKVGDAYTTDALTYVRWDGAVSFQAYAHSFITEIT